MAYNVTKFDGTPLTTIVDGSYNDLTTDVKLLGKGVTNFGEIMAENLVWMVEHFASETEPAKPLQGQIWYDKTIDTLFVYKGITLGWSPLGGAATGGEPTNPLVGDLWWDPSTRQLKNWDDDLHGTGVAGWDVQGSTLFFDSLPNATADPTVYPPGQNEGDPSVAETLDGDMWWDTGNKQLYVYNGYQARWVLVGPSTPGGAASPAVLTTTDVIGGNVTDTSGNHSILKVIADDEVIGVWSQDDVAQDNNGFTPAITSFPDLTRGLNVDGAVVPTTTLTHSLGTVDNQWANLYVESLHVSGPTVGPMDLGNNRLENVGNPDTDDDAMPRSYADGRYLRRDAHTEPTADNTFNLGHAGAKFLSVHATTFEGTATTAQYADIAERYAVDNKVEPGDLVMIGGEAEVTKTTDSLCMDVFGVVSTDPAYMMNSVAGSNETHPYIALAGRVPVKCTGTVKKGQRLVSSNIPGVARSIDNVEANSHILSIFGRALEDKTTEEVELIEASVGVK